MEVVDAFKRGNFKVMGLCETKLKGNGEEEWNNCGVKCIRAGVSETSRRAKEGVGMLICQEWYEKMSSFECVSSRCLIVKFKFPKVKVAVIVAYAPCEDREESVKNDFWRELNAVIERVPRSFRKIVMGDMNGKVGTVPERDVVGPYGVDGENDNGRRMKDLCRELRLCV